MILKLYGYIYILKKSEQLRIDDQLFKYLTNIEEGGYNWFLLIKNKHNRQKFLNDLNFTC